MIYLLIQSFGLMLLTFLVGLPIGDGLGRLFRFRHHKMPVRSPAPRSLELSPKPERVPQIAAAMTPVPIVMPPATVPQAIPWSDIIVFPVSSFGFTVKCCPLRIERTTPRTLATSPLAGRSAAEQHRMLAQTRFAHEPERLWGAEGEADDLTRLNGLDTEDAQKLNGLGIFHTWQIAQWQPAHVLWLSWRLKDPQRIVTNDWISQASRLTQ